MLKTVIKRKAETMLARVQRVKIIWCHSASSRMARTATRAKTTMYQKRKRAVRRRFVPVESSLFDAMMNSAHIRLRLKAAQRSEPALPIIKALLTNAYWTLVLGWLEPKA
eukprot:4923730-Pleurochrysis_carterae.AAC.11